MTPHRSASFAHPSRNIDAFGLRSGMTVVDFGSGSGAYVFEISKRLGGMGKVYAVDIQQDLLRRIRSEAHSKGLKYIETIWSDLELPNGSKLSDEYADLVLISNLLFQVSEKSVVLSEARRILNPAGILAIIDWSDSYRGMGPHKKEVFKKEQALALAEKAGFELVREFDAGAHHYGLLMRLKMSDTTKTV